MRVGGVGVPARGYEAQDCLVELNADLYLPRLTDRVDPERPLDIGVDLIGQGAVKKVEEGFGLSNGVQCGPPIGVQS